MNTSSMVPQSFMIDRLKMYNVADKVIKFIKETMKNWRVELTTRNKNITEMKIQRHIFQGGTQSPLSYVIAMIPQNQILSKDTDG